MAEHVRREEEERISWLHSLVYISSFLIMALIELNLFIFFYVQQGQCSAFILEAFCMIAVLQSSHVALLD